MKVRCVRLLDSLGKPTDRSHWAKVGAVYHVLSISIEPLQTRFRLVGEEPTPALFEPEMFEVVSAGIPSVWVVSSSRPGCLALAPEAWSKPGFWESFFDGEPAAVACFEEYREKIVGADP